MLLTTLVLPTLLLTTCSVFLDLDVLNIYILYSERVKNMLKLIKQTVQISVFYHKTLQNAKVLLAMCIGL